MTEIIIDSFKYAIGKINDGFIFENFGLAFLGAVLGYEFVPSGGVKDRGIDGLQHIFSKKSYEKYIYQLSTEINSDGKIRNSLEKLINNKIKFDSFCYVTNRTIKNQEALIDQLFDEYGKQIKVFDQNWFVSHANDSQTTINAYNSFITSYFHEFNKPGKSYIVSDLDTDSRLFVFLRQQLENSRDDFKLDELLADTLILFALEGTDPDKGIFRTVHELKNGIKQYVKFDPKILNQTIDKRLKVLSTKPRKIKYHSKTKAYCLPYETRLEIQERNLQDKQLLEKFYTHTEEKIKKYLKGSDVSVRNLTQLINEVVHKIYYIQGLEFSNFILHGECKDVVEKDLPEIIGQVVDESSVVAKNKEDVKASLLMAIRDIVYNGSTEQKRYLKSLSNTYTMMFLLQWDPKIATYFQSMASKLRIFVCTSIIIPALSEYYLEPQNRRHWNLLKGVMKCRNKT